MRARRRGRGWTVAIAGLWAAVAPASVAGQTTPGPSAPARFMPWQDPAPFARPFLQLPFDAPEPLRAGTTELGLRTLYSNTVIRARTPRLSADVSVEEAAPMLFVRRGFDPGFELEVAVPGIIDYAGFLARPIKAVESVFASVNTLRVGPPPREARFRVARPDGAATPSPSAPPTRMATKPQRNSGDGASGS